MPSILELSISSVVRGSRRLSGAMSSSDSSSDSRDSSALLTTAKRRRLVTLAKWEEQLRKKEQESTPPQIVRTMIATFTYTISKSHFVSNPPVFDRLDSVLDRLVMTYYV